MTRRSLTIEEAQHLIKVHKACGYTSHAKATGFNEFIVECLVNRADRDPTRHIFYERDEENIRGHDTYSGGWISRQTDNRFTWEPFSMGNPDFGLEEISLAEEIVEGLK